MKKIYTTLLSDDGYSLQHIEMPVVELAQQVFDSHLVSMYLKPATILHQHRQHDAKDHFVCGDLGIYPADVYGLVKLYEPVDKFHFHLQPSLLAERVYATFGVQHFTLQEHFKVADDLLKALLFTLAETAREPQPDQIYADTLVDTLISHLFKHYGNRTTTTRTDGKIGANEIAQVKNFILSHLDQPIRLRQLAEVLQMSEFHFARLFKNSTGTSPVQYAQRVKIERAKDLIRQRKTFSEVAFQTGYHDESHFAKQFRKQTGFTPSQFREQ